MVAECNCKIIARVEERIRDLFKEAGEIRPPQPRAVAGEAAQAHEAKRNSLLAWCHKGHARQRSI